MTKFIWTSTLLLNLFLTSVALCTELVLDNHTQPPDVTHELRTKTITFLAGDYIKVESNGIEAKFSRCIKNLCHPIGEKTYAASDLKKLYEKRTQNEDMWAVEHLIFKAGHKSSKDSLLVRVKSQLTAALYCELKSPIAKKIMAIHSTEENDFIIKSLKGADFPASGSSICDILAQKNPLDLNEVQAKIEKELSFIKH